MVLWIFIVPVADAAVYNFGQGKINIPVGFVGPKILPLNSTGKMIAFTKAHEDKSNTLLQITIFTPDEKIGSDGDKIDDEENYLLQILSGIERRRTSFIKSEVEPMKISGIPACKVDWSGDSNGSHMHGVMYSVIKNNSLIIIHTQEFSKSDDSSFRNAVNSIENIIF